MERGEQYSPVVRQLGERLFSFLGFHPTDLLWQRLGRVVQQQARRAGFADVDSYVQALLHAPDHELVPLAEALTINETYFFREPKHFDALAAHLPDLARQSRPVRLLSAGCATGEEAYSLAIVASAVLRSAGIPFEVIGVDIDRTALEKAKAGRYRTWSFRDQGMARARDAIEPVGDDWQVRATIRQHVRFEQCNLVDRAPAGPFHAIFCRNMLMYLTPEHRRAVVRRLADVLIPGGLFIIGSAETLDDVPPELERQPWQGVTLYRRRRVPSSTVLPSSSPPARVRSQQLRVLVVSRSPIVRLGLRTVLGDAPGIVLLGEARSWEDAEPLVNQADVLVLDALNDDSVLTAYLASTVRRVPTLVLTATPRSGTGLSARRVATLVMPQARLGTVQSHGSEIISRLIELANAGREELSRTGANVGASSSERKPGTGWLGMQRPWSRLLVIGSSTGGPAVVSEIVRQLPGGLGLAIVIVQHMPAGFTRSFAERLGRLSTYAAREAQTGDVLQADTIYVAPGHQNVLIERGGRLRVVPPGPEDIYVPNVTKAFRSVARSGLATKTMAVILTGMGDDGGDGMAELAAAGAYTVAQEPSEAVVSGMIEAAIARQGVRKILPAADIPSEVVRWLHQSQTLARATRPLG
ncbi:chemotaxis protein CheB [Thermorudis peleae]|uniref:chemotaxis protein CheB n=1 Tax=Thermorudis peleae TaxID=1382356 RepID=UPI00068AD488|nr:chemotaxis protein CheB [Thermorudis peleae]